MSTCLQLLVEWRQAVCDGLLHVWLELAKVLVRIQQAGSSCLPAGMLRPWLLGKHRGMQPAQSTDTGQVAPHQAS